MLYLDTFTYQLEEDNWKNAGKQAHDRNLHDDFEDVLLVISWIFRHLDVVIEEERTAESIQDNHALWTETHTKTYDSKKQTVQNNGDGVISKNLMLVMLFSTCTHSHLN